MDWQDIAVIITVGAALIYTAGKVFTRCRNTSDICSSCDKENCPKKVKGER